MSMNTILREKRKALGLTQEQVATSLGVTTPAVNKWEKGATCPDLMLLPALARLLKTDPNTLLQFQETLSQQEIWQFLNGVGQQLQMESITLAQGFAQVLTKTQEYPNCTELQHAAAMTLDGALMMSDTAPEQRREYRETVLTLYRCVAESSDTALADNAKYMLATKLIEDGAYAKAQEMLDLLPDWSALDKRGMQADVWNKQGEHEKAASLLERKLITSVQDHQSTLCRLIAIAVQEGDNATALALADCAQKECQAFRFGAYWEQIGPLEAAMRRQDTAETLRVLSLLLEAACAPGSFAFSPLFSHLTRKEPTADFGAQFLKQLLQNLEASDPQYEFLHGEPKFQALLETYRAKCIYSHST